jgi:hypothetical protein
MTHIPLFEVMSNALELYEFDQSAENHGALMQAVHNYVKDKEKPDDGYCKACDGDFCTAKKGCVARDNPPYVREWIGLTDQEYRQLHAQNGDGYFYQDYGRDIEAKLKEKNHG